MGTDISSLQRAARKHKISQLIVAYLKLQQNQKNNFFTLFLQNKINGRLFYNTCLPDGTKETRYGNDDFINADFKQAIEQLLTPFQHLTLAQVKSESVQASEFSAGMHDVISSFMSCIESSSEWKLFWKEEINLQTDDAQKKKLYNLIAGAAAYKVLVSCIDQSEQIQDPMIKRNMATLINLCTSTYESRAFENSQKIAVTNHVKLDIAPEDHHAIHLKLT